MPVIPTLVLGEPGSGKTLSQVPRVVACKRAACLDWHVRSLNWESVKHLAADGRRFAFDNLGWVKHGIPWKVFRPAKGSEKTREKRNEAAVRELAEDLMESQDRTTLANTPLIETATIATLTSYLYQSKPFRLRKLYRVLDPEDPLYARAVANNTHPQSRKLMSSWKSLSKSARRYELGGAQRMFYKVFTSSAFASRCDGNFDIVAFLNHDEGGHYFLEGGDVCEEARRVLFRIILRKLIKAAMRGQFEDVVTVFLDESHQFAHLAVKMLRELRKFNLEIVCITQSLPSEWKTDALECFRRLEIHRCNNPESARMFAGMLAPLMGGDVPVSEIQGKIMDLKPGWRYVREWKAWKEYVPLPTDPYPWLGLTETRTWKAIKESMGKYGRELSSGGSEPTPARRPKSAKPWRSSTPPSPSPAIKLLRGFSRDSNGNVGPG